MNQDDPNSRKDGASADPAVPPHGADRGGARTVAANADAPTGEAGVSNRRRLLMLGAISASAVVTIRPALAQTAGSVLNCQIPVPDPARAGNWISPEGELVAPATPGAFPPAPRPLTGEEVRTALNSRGAYSGIEYDASQAYTNYIRRLQLGTSGFTCYASLQMPRG